MKTKYQTNKLLVILLVSITLISGCNGLSKDTLDYDNHIENARQYVLECTPELAIIELEKAIALQPEKPKAYVKLSQIYLEATDYETASKILLEGFDKNKDDQEIALLCADVEIYLSHLDSAKWVLTTLDASIGQTEMTILRLENINRLSKVENSQMENSQMHEFTLDATSYSKNTRHEITHLNRPQNMFDNDLSTIWSEASPGNGVGEKITITSKPSFDLKTLSLTNGFAYDETSYYDNNRLLKLKVTSDSGNEKIISFSDGILEMQDVIIGFENVEKLTLEVLEVKQGRLSNDLCISEMRFNNQLATTTKDVIAEETSTPDLAEEKSKVKVANISECMLEASEYLFDNKLETAWSEQTPGDGVGEKIIIKSSPAFSLQTISIINGYAKNKDKYEQNNRVLKLKISSDQGDEKIITFRDGVMDFQEMIVGFKKVEELTLEILEISKGSQFNDLCISEIKINGVTPKVKLE